MLKGVKKVDVVQIRHARNKLSQVGRISKEKGVWKCLYAEWGSLGKKKEKLEFLNNHDKFSLIVSSGFVARGTNLPEYCISCLSRLR